MESAEEFLNRPPLAVRDLVIDPAGCTVERAGVRVPGFTVNQLRLLYILMQREGIITTAAQVAAAIDDSMPEHRVENQIGRVRRLLRSGPGDGDDYIRTVRGRGFVFDLEPVPRRHEG